MRSPALAPSKSYNMYELAAHRLNHVQNGSSNPADVRKTQTRPTAKHTHTTFTTQTLNLKLLNLKIIGIIKSRIFFSKNYKTPNY